MGYECMMCMESLDSPAPKGPALGNNKNKAGSKNEMQPIEDLSEICGTPCGHIFHSVCLKRWLKETGHKTCPSCRKEVSKSKIFTVYLHALSSDDLSNNPNKLPNLEERKSPPCICEKQQCIDLHEIHKTLICDFNDLREKYAEKVDETSLLNGKNVSLTAEDAGLRKENAGLREENSRLRKLLQDAGLAVEEKHSNKRTAPVTPRNVTDSAAKRFKKRSSI